MRTIKMTTGAPLDLDGDLMTVMEALYKEVSAKEELKSSFEDMAREIAHIIGMALLFGLMAMAFKNDVEKRWDVIRGQIGGFSG